MDTWDDFTDTGFGASLVAQVRDIFALLANDHASFFCSNEGAKSDGRCGIFIVCLGIGIVVSNDVVHGRVVGIL